MSRYQFIAAEKAQHSVAQVCRVLQVAPSGYYVAAPSAIRSPAGQPDADRADSGHSRREPLHVRRAAHPCRAAGR